MSLLAAVVLGGCGEIEWPGSRSSPPSRRVQANQQARATPQKEPESRPSAAPEAKPAVAASAKPQTPPREAADELFRLDLVRNPQPDERVPAGAVRLRHAPPRACARALEMLYPTLGSGGSAQHSYLLYRDEASYRAASELVRRLDVPASHDGASDPFASGVAGLLDLCLRVAASDSEAVRRCEADLSRAAEPTATDPKQRWAAAMLAGRVAADHRFAHDEARRFFKQAEDAAPPGSLEQMIAIGAAADTFEDEGDDAQSRAWNARITKTFGEYRDSYVYQRAVESSE